MSFSLDLQRLVDKYKANAVQIKQKVVIDVGVRIVERSPVGNPDLWKHPPPPGYVGGRFRANWQYGFSEPPQGDLPDIDASGSVSNERIAQVTTAFGVDYIVNNLPYAQRLEDGWSTQAPSGMVGLTVVEYQDIVAKAVGETK